jgi:predicted chitinase
MRTSLLLVLLALVAILAFAAASEHRGPHRHGNNRRHRAPKDGEEKPQRRRWTGERKQKKDVAAPAETESDKKINFDDIFEWIGKGKTIYDMFKKNKQAPVEAEEESDAFNAHVSVEDLREIMPHLSSSKASAYIGHVNDAMNWAGITTCKRISAFLAQVAHESGEFRYMEELASGSAYEGRKDLGNTQPGDGRRYKGRGPIQVTGRANYRSAGNAIGHDFEDNPTDAALPQWGFKIAAWFWNSRNLNSYADSGNFDMITKRINGGYNGKADRDQFYARAKRVLGC